MKTRLLAGAACAALTVLSVPARAATNPELPTAAAYQSGGRTQAVDAFYAARGGAPLWLRSGGDSSAARELMGVLQRASLDGMPNGPATAVQAEALDSPRSGG